MPRQNSSAFSCGINLCPTRLTSCRKSPNWWPNIANWNNRFPRPHEPPASTKAPRSISRSSFAAITRSPAKWFRAAFWRYSTPRRIEPSKAADSNWPRALRDPQNPLVSRVIVNRLWHHLFGVGIVPTTDNFGRLGDEPTQPELLDYLAWQFSGQGPISGQTTTMQGLRAECRRSNPGR